MAPGPGRVGLGAPLRGAAGKRALGAARQDLSSGQVQVGLLWVILGACLGSVCSCAAGTGSQWKSPGWPWAAAGRGSLETGGVTLCFLGKGRIKKRGLLGSRSSAARKPSGRALWCGIPRNGTGLKAHGLDELLLASLKFYHGNGIFLTVGL